MAQTLISIPVWNCLPRISQTPWFGMALIIFKSRFDFLSNLNLKLGAVDTSVLESGSRKNTTSNFCHHIDDFDSELAYIWIVVESSVGNKISDLTLSIRSRSDKIKKGLFKVITSRWL